ncbi:MAG: hypothetical protein LPK80_10775 [Bacteroidota bacterium]|nr:hypothetical protein [Bacteroidota bacterium]MDX5429394.1 hypothetical protein [Bacteroidota bacterium]
MKNAILWSFSTLLFLSITGCKKINELTVFDLQYEAEVLIPSSINQGLPLAVNTPDIQTNSSTRFENNDTRKDLIQEIKLTELNLYIENPPSQNFDFLKSVEIYINASGLNSQLVAYRNDIPDGQGQQLSLFTTDADLQEYIKKDEFYLEVEVVTDQLITQSVRIKALSNFRVDAKILGI